MNSSYEAIQALARVFGIEQEYTDNWGRVFKTSPSIMRNILETKGVRLDPGLLSTAHQVVTLTEGSIPSQVSIHMDLTQSFLDELRKDGLVTVTAQESGIALMSQPINNSSLVEDFDKETGLALVTVPLPDNLAIGDHRFLVTVHSETSTYSVTLEIIVGPAKAYTPRLMEDGQKIAGIAVSLYGVRSETNWGVGDFADLERIIDWAFDDLGAHFVGLNPLHALFNACPYNCSPYMPSSRTFCNLIYIDVPKAARRISEKVAHGILNDPSIQETSRKLREYELVDYEGVSSLKIKALRSIFDQFRGAAGSPDIKDVYSEFERYVELGGESLNRFATFCVLRDFFLAKSPDLRSWMTWPEDFQHPGSEDVQRFRERNTVEIMFHEFIQWVCESQLADAQRYALSKGMLVGLYHDLALAVDPDGADSWSTQEYFVRGFSVGAPPDAFAPEGQDWGFQPPNSHQVRMSGFAPFRNSLRVGCKHGGALRIDHVMQIHHLFWIPRGQSASYGVYVKDFEEDLLNVLAMESATNHTMVVGEDLGTLPFNFRERLIDRGIYSYRVFYFERDENFNQAPYFNYPAGALVSLSTHDLPTFSGFWQGLDIDERLAIGRIKPEEEIAARSERTTQKAKIIERLVSDGVLPPEVAHRAWESTVPTDELHTAVLSFIFRTPCRLAIISLEDLFGDVRQQNLPGTTIERPNWVTKTRFTVEELKSHSEALRLTVKFRKLLEDSGRLVKSEA
jgi:4-alpha-glucanotransferase